MYALERKPKQAPVSQSLDSQQVSWSNFSNIKYQYSFKYPSELILTTAEDQLGIDEKESSRIVSLHSANPDFWFDVQAEENIPDLSLQSISKTFALPLTGLEPVMAGTVSAVEPTLSDNTGVVSHFYFVQDKKTKNVLQITFPKNNALAASILNTFQFINR